MARKLGYGIGGIAGLIVVVLVVSTLLGSSDETATPTDTHQAPASNGRMSHPEYRKLYRVTRHLDYVLVEYGQILRTCIVPPRRSAGRGTAEADARDCIMAAHDGVSDHMLVVLSMIERREGEVKQGCLKALKLFRERLGKFLAWHERVEDAAERLRFDEYRSLASLRTMMTGRYGQGRDWARRDCQPK